MDKTFYQQYKDLDRGLNSRQFLDSLMALNHEERKNQGLSCNCKTGAPKFGLPDDKRTKKHDGPCELEHYNLINSRFAIVGELWACPCQIKDRLMPATEPHGGLWVDDATLLESIVVRNNS
jgi:hypothetical protein